MSMASNRYFCRGRIRPLFFLTIALLLLQVAVVNVYFEDISWVSIQDVTGKINRWTSRLFENVRKEFLRNDVACRIPKLDPLHESIKHLIMDPANPNCEDGYPLLFKSTFNSTLLPLKSLKELIQLGIKGCCYNRIRRTPGTTNDNAYVKTIKCFPISLVKATVVPPDHEFVTIHCEYEPGYLNPKNLTITSKLVDAHAFVHLHSNVEQRIQKLQPNLPNNKVRKVNVVIIGIDATSHMSFIRSMPNSLSFLRDVLGAVEMHGYNVIGPNTYPNVVAALTSRTEKEINSTCLEDRYFDNCPLIWKNFSENGFRTAYGEDNFFGGVFNHLMNGFKTIPTDYYLTPFGNAAGNLRRSSTDLCYGPRLSWQVLLDYTQKLAHTMGKDKRYFQFIWSTALTHEGLNDGRLGDKPLLSTLKWFYESGHFNQTIMIVMSDHGLRDTAILNIMQGQLEKRMPFMFILTPPWFKEEYAQAYHNLVANQDILSTPHDLYETVADLITLEHITTQAIQAREKSLNQSSSMPRGISLFLPIPLARTCQMAGIADHWCVCRNLKEITTENISVKQAATYVLHTINLDLSRYTQCVLLSLGAINDAKYIMTGDREQYQISIETTPGNASFQATVGRNKDGLWFISGSIERTNSYKNQSHCVDTREAKPYCYCTDLIQNQPS